MVLRILPPTQKSRSLFWSFVLVLSLFVFFFLLQRESPRISAADFAILDVIGNPKITSDDGWEWLYLQSGTRIENWRSIETGPQDEIDLRMRELGLILRVKENTRLNLHPAASYKKFPFELALEKGTLIVSSDQDWGREGLAFILPGEASPKKHFVFETGAVLLEMHPESQTFWAGLLKGRASLKQGVWKSATVNSLQKIEFKKGGTGEKSMPLSRTEWNRIREAYELGRKKEIEDLKRQMDLSKQAGDFFQYVFDHGSFYTPNMGYALREFVRDENSDGMWLQIEYDVYAPGSFVGMYLKTRGLEVIGAHTLSFQIRAHPGETPPESVRVEMKSGSRIVRAFVVQPVGQDWSSVKFPMKFPRSVSINEVTFVFSHDQSGPVKRGVVDVRNLTFR